MLNTDEIKQYEREGLVIPNASLGADYVHKLRAQAESFIDAHPELNPDYIPSLIERDSKWLEFARHPTVLDCVADLIGEDIILWGSGLFCKSARGGKATPWHQDGQYWPIRPLETVTVWIAFDDVNAANGCMRYVPGSHLERTLHPHDTDDNDAYTLNQKIRASEAAESQGRDVELRQGMFSIHDVYLIHGSNRNDSGHRRGGLTLRYMPATSLYDRDLARQQVRELGVIDISDRRLHLVRGRDRAGNDLHRADA